MRRETAILFVLRSVSVLAVLFGNASVQAQPSYSFLPDVRVNQDAPGVGYHSTGFTNGHSIGSFMGNPVIVWYGGPGISDHHIYFSRSLDGGTSFLSPIKLDSSPMLEALYPTLLCASNGDIFVSWQDSVAGSWHIYIARSTNGGQSFGAPTRVDSSGQFTQLPSLAEDDSGVIYCTWTGVRGAYSSIYLAWSTDRGASFGPAVDIDSTAERPVNAGVSSVGAAGPGDVFLSWRDNRTDTIAQYPFHVYFVKSTDGGSSFTPAVRVDTPGEVSGSFPCLAVDDIGQHVMITHKERSLIEGYGIFSAQSNDGGSTFSLVGRLDSSADSDVPSLALRDAFHAYLVWFDTRHGGNVYFSYSTDGGVSFSHGQRVNGDFDSVAYWAPHVALGRGDTVFVCWTDGRLGSSNPDVCFAKGYPSVGGIADEVEGEARLQSQVRVTPSPARDVIRFTLLARRPTSITLEVSDACGRIVRQFRDIEVRSGLPRYVEWNTRDARSKVPAGIYFYRWYAGSRGSPSASETGSFCLVQSH